MSDLTASSNNGASASTTAPAPQVEAWTLDHCDAFSAEEVVDGDEAESSHEQYQLFTAFREFIDKDLLGEWLAAQGLSYSDFTEACIDAVDTSEAASQWIGILSASFEFPLFVQIMRVAKLKLENLGDPRNIPPPPEERVGMCNNRRERIIF